MKVKVKSFVALFHLNVSYNFVFEEIFLLGYYIASKTALFLAAVIKWLLDLAMITADPINNLIHV